MTTEQTSILDEITTTAAGDGSFFAADVQVYDRTFTVIVRPNGGVSVEVLSPTFPRAVLPVRRDSVATSLELLKALIAAAEQERDHWLAEYGTHEERES